MRKCPKSCSSIGESQFQVVSKFLYITLSLFTHFRKHVSLCNLPTNCWSVFDHFVILVLKGSKHQRLFLGASFTFLTERKIMSRKILKPQTPGGKKNSCILQQTCSFQLQVFLSMYDLSLPPGIKQLIILCSTITIPISLILG